TPPPPTRPAVLIGGLGVGFSLAHAAAQDAWGRIAVAERESAIVDWHRGGPLAELSAEALADPRVEILLTDLVAYLHTTTDRYDALCLDIDNGPDWTVTEDNGSLYSPSGLAACRARLNPDGVLAVWSAQPSPTFEEAMRNAGFQQVRTEEVPVARGVPDVVHLGRNPA
uniref:spermidine synthase n=1 Tax=Streptomyces sp. NRRL S-87 TaxID=1463920 RepID=UPI0004BF7DED